MLWSSSQSPERLEALERVKAWTRERFQLPQEAAILVAEIACTLPGCVPLETVIAFWTEDGTRHQFKVFKRAEEVLEGDLPFAWMKDALAVVEGSEADCC